MIVDELFGLQGKVALVTGAGQGLGQGYALALARAGCRCICTDLDTARLAQTVTLLGGEGLEALPIAMDVTDMDSIRKGFAEAMEECGRVDIVVNNAGTEIAEPFLDVTPAHYDTIMSVNHKGTYFVMQEAARYMKEQGSGKVINIGSLGSFIGLADSSVYCSSKGGVVQLTKTAALELAKYGIQVNAIAPGYFLTTMTKPFFEDKEHREWIENRIPLGKVGTSDDLAGALIFLASGASNYITGQVVTVDGGWMAG